MKSIALLAVAGLATVATAQINVNATDFTLSLAWSANDIAVGDVVTGTLSGSWTGSGTTYMSSVNIDLLADNAIGNASNLVVAWNNALLGFDGQGQASGADILTIDAAQTSLFAPPQTGNPFVIGTFTFTATAEGTMTYSFDTSPLGTTAAFTVSDTSLPTANPAQFGGVGDPAVISNIETLTVVPAPSAMALLGLGGLVATRRRR